jgi:heme-degrading monooxygenase HmoA
LSQPYTCGIWTVKPGREEEFINGWQELADWTLSEVPGAMWARLLQDRSNPSRFVSVGPWASLDAIEAWRGLPAWREQVERLRGLLDGFEPSTLDQVGSVGSV